MQRFSTTFSQPYPKTLLTLQSVSHPIPQSFTPHNVNINHAATCSILLTPSVQLLTSRYLFVTPVIPPTFGHTAPIPLWRGGPSHPSPSALAAKNASLINALADAKTSKRKDPLPEWKLSQYNGDPLQ